MLKLSRILVGTDVWLAYFAGEEERCAEALDLFEACAEHDIDLLYTPISFKDVFCLVQDAMISRDDDAIDQQLASVAWACVAKMAEVATAVSLSVPECEIACRMSDHHADLEENLLIAAADTSKASCVATFDEGLAARFAPVCATPQELARLIRSLPV